MDLSRVELTSQLFWQDALIITVVDLLIIGLILRRMSRERFRQLRWPLVMTAAVFWAVFAYTLYGIFWNSYYRYFGSNWLHHGGSIVLGTMLGLVMTLTAHWAACRLRGNPLVNFFLFIGLGSILEHLWGFYGLRILEIPMLRSASPISILAFAFSEYIFYWCLVMVVTLFLQSIWKWMRVIHTRLHKA